MRSALIAILSILLVHNSFAQKKEFAVVLIEMTHNNKLDGTKYTQWIVPMDSISAFDFKQESIFPLMIEDYTKDNLDSCKLGKQIAFTLIGNPDNTFDKDFIISLKKFSQEILKNRKLVQTIKKIYSSGYKEEIKVFITPVKGNFCKCPLFDNWRYDIGYKGDIFLAISDFEIIPDFWNRPIAKNVMSIDFSARNQFNNQWK